MHKYSNTPIETSTILENMDKSIFVPYIINKENKNPLIIDNIINAFVDENGEYITFIQEIQKYIDDDIVLENIKMTDLMEIVLSKQYKGIFFHDILDTDNFLSSTFISYKDIYKNRNIIEIHQYLQKYKSKELPKHDLIKQLFNKYFYFITFKYNKPMLLNPPNNNTDNKEYYIVLFTTSIIAKEFKKKYKIDGEIQIDTLSNIVKNDIFNHGIFINPISASEFLIDNDVLKENIQSNLFHHTDQTIREHIKKYLTLKEFFVVLNVKADYDNQKGCFVKCMTRKEKDVDYTINIFENYENACKYIDANFVEIVEETRPIGIIKTMEEFQNLLHRAHYIQAKSICFEADTPQSFITTVENVYQTLFNEPFRPHPINETYLIPFYEPILKKGLTFERKKEITENISDYLLPIIFQGNIEETLCCLAYYNQLYKEKKQ